MVGSLSLSMADGFALLPKANDLTPKGAIEIGLFDHLDRDGKPDPLFYEGWISIARAFEPAQTPRAAIEDLRALPMGAMSPSPPSLASDPLSS